MLEGEGVDRVESVVDLLFNTYHISHITYNTAMSEREMRDDGKSNAGLGGRVRWLGFGGWWLVV